MGCKETAAGELAPTGSVIVVVLPFVASSKQLQLALGQVWLLFVTSRRALSGSVPWSAPLPTL